MKKLFLTIIGCFLWCNAWATVTLIGGQITGANGNLYGTLNECGAGSSSASARTMSVAAGVISDLYVYLDTTPAAGNSWTVSLYNVDTTSDTALTTTITAGNQSGSDTTHSVSVSVGTNYAIRVVYGTAATTTNISYCFKFTSATTGQTMLMGGTAGNSVSTATRYISLAGPTTVSSSQGGSSRMVIPCSGVLSGFSAHVSTAGGAGQTQVLTIEQSTDNGSTWSDTTQTVTYSNETGVKTSTGNSVTVSAGDLIEVKYTNAEGGATSTTVRCSVIFTPTIEGQFIIPANGSGGSLATSGAQFNTVWGTAAWDAVASTNLDNLFQACTIKNMYVSLSGTPGAGKSYTFDLQVGGVDSSPALSVSLTGGTAGLGATYGNASADVGISLNNLVNTEATPSGTPSARTAYISYTGYIAPAAATSYYGVMRISR